MGMEEEKLTSIKSENESYKPGVGYGMQIGYALLLDFFLPVQTALMFAGIISESGEDKISSFLLNLADLAGKLYVCIVIVFSIVNIVRSFKAYRENSPSYCVNSMLILKYGLIPFFIQAFTVTVLFILIFTLGGFVASRGTIIFMLIALWPLALAWGVAVGLILTGLTIIILLPGAFYGIQVVRYTLKEKKTSSGFAVMHGILQFVPFFDNLDAMYLAVKKWKLGKKSSIAVATAYILLLLSIIACIVLLVIALSKV
jgi:hypothetical protein